MEIKQQAKTDTDDKSSGTLYPRREQMGNYDASVKEFLFKSTGVEQTHWKRISKSKTTEGDQMRIFEDKESGRLVQVLESRNGALTIEADSPPTSSQCGIELVTLAYGLDKIKHDNPTSAQILQAVDAAGFDITDEQCIELANLDPFDMDSALALPIFSSEGAVASILEVTYYRVVKDGDQFIIELSDGAGLRGGDNGLFLGLIERTVNEVFYEYGLDNEGSTEGSLYFSGDLTDLSIALKASGMIWADGSNALAESGLHSTPEDAMSFDHIHGKARPRSIKSPKKS